MTSMRDSHGGRLRHGQVRIVPSAWGSRRDDDYRWDKGTGTRHDVVSFRAAAAAAAGVLVRHPLAVWSAALPGTMADVMGSRSDLYLADYWVLVLHHLVWTGRLPYPVHAQWVEGSGSEPGPYRFASELPTDLTEASREVLILLEELAVTSLNGYANEQGSGLDTPKDIRSAVVPRRPVGAVGAGTETLDAGQCRLAHRWTGRDRPGPSRDGRA